MAEMSNSRFARDQDAREMLIQWPGSSYQDYLGYINRFDLPEGFAYLDGLRGYVFISRPDLNLFSSDLILNEQSAAKLGFNELVGSSRYPDDLNVYIAKILMRNTGYPSSFICPLTNRIKSYSPEDQRLDVIDVGETLHGQRIRYGRHSGQSRQSGSISLTFEDDKFLTIYKLVCLWTDYIEMVYLGDLKPNDYYIRQNKLDYATSLFFIVTRNTAEPVPTSNNSLEMKEGYEVVYWDKKTGIFPTTRPDSAFAFTKGQFIQPEFTVQFDYSIPSKSSILDPYVLSEFNTMNRWQHNSNVTAFPVFDTWDNPITGGTYRDVGMKFVNVPSIYRANGKFYLEWM